jgi:hypothetical protein
LIAPSLLESGVLLLLRLEIKIGTPIEIKIGTKTAIAPREKEILETKANLGLQVILL